MSGEPTVARILVLGGTAEASELVRRLGPRPGLDVVTSFAGRTPDPRPPAGEVRVGGFGGVPGLTAHLLADGVDVLVDATHPCAAEMRWHAAAACASVGVPRLRLERPSWEAGPGDRWQRVADLAAAADAVAHHRRAFLTVGRTGLGAFARCHDTWFLVRTITDPHPLPLRQACVIRGRGPFPVATERALMCEHEVEVLVTKDSGGAPGRAKLDAARALGLPVVVVDRPPTPPGQVLRGVDDAEAAVLALVAR